MLCPAIPICTDLHELKLSGISNLSGLMSDIELISTKASAADHHNFVRWQPNLRCLDTGPNPKGVYAICRGREPQRGQAFIHYSSKLESGKAGAVEVNKEHAHDSRSDRE